MDSQTAAESQPTFGGRQPPQLRVNVVQAETGRCRVILGGELDLMTVGQLRDALALLYQSGTMVMVELAFLGLCGVQAIVDADVAAANADSQDFSEVLRADGTVSWLFVPRYRRHYT